MMLVVFLGVRGDYLITDTFNHHAQLCTSSGTCTTVAGTGVGGDIDTQLNQPRFVAITATGDYLISDHSNHRVQLCPAHGAGSPCTTVAGTSGQGSGRTQLNGPSAPHIDGNGDLLSADYHNHRVQLCAFFESRNEPHHSGGDGHCWFRFFTTEVSHLYCCGQCGPLRGRRSLQPPHPALLCTHRRDL